MPFVFGEIKTNDVLGTKIGQLDSLKRRLKAFGRKPSLDAPDTFTLYHDSVNTCSLYVCKNLC